MAKPYQPPETVGDTSLSRRPVRRHLLGALLLFCIGVTASVPGFLLLNQELGWIPTQPGITGIEFNGRPISNGAAICYSIGFSAALIAIAFFLFVMGMRNWRMNRLVNGRPDQ